MSVAGPPQATKKACGAKRGPLSAARPLLVGAMALSGCATPNLADAPKIVQGYTVASYQIHEECVGLKPGDRVEYRFESTEPVDFNIHYREGNAVVMPLVREKSLEDAGMYSVRIARDYCLMWEAGAAGATIDYRIRVRPAES